MKSKILKSEKIIENGRISYLVVKGTKYGVFTGQVSVCNEDMPEDLSSISDMNGYKYSERKCDIQALHEKAKRLRSKVEGVEHLLTVLTNKYEETSSSETEEQKKLLKDIEHQLGIFRREYEDVYRKYCYMKKDFRDYTTRNNENRLKTLKDLQKD